MKYNVGTVDSLVRIITGTGVVLTGIALHNLWGAVGLYPLITGITKKCIIYLPLGITTIVENSDSETKQ